MGGVSLSILKLETSPDQGQVYAPYIQSIDIEITNQGSDYFEALILVYGPDEGLLFRGLYSLAPSVSIPIIGVGTYYNDFKVVLVTNVNTYANTAVNIICWKEEDMIAIYTQEQMERYY